MTAAVITLALLALALGGVIVLLVRRLDIKHERALTRAWLDEGKARLEEERLKNEAIDERNATQAVLDKTAAELQDALAKNREAEAALNAALKGNLDAVAAKVRDADDPLAALHAVLREVSEAADASAPSGTAAPEAGDGREGSPAVQPTGEAEATGDRGSP